MFGLKVGVLKRQKQRVEDFLEHIYQSPQYLSQLLHHESTFRSWFYVVLVVEFDINAGHQVRIEYPPGVLSEQEKSRLIHLSLPDSCSTNRPCIFKMGNVINNGKNGWLGFRFLRDNALPLANSSLNESSFLLGASFFRTVKDTKCSRGARQESVAVLSPLPTSFFYPLLLPVTIYMGTFFFLKGKDTIFDACGSIASRWPSFPSCTQSCLHLTLETRSSNPLELYCRIHASDVDLLGCSSLKPQAKLLRSKYHAASRCTNSYRLHYSCLPLYTKKVSSRLTPQYVVLLWKWLRNTSHVQRCFFLSRSNIPLQRPRTPETMSSLPSRNTNRIKCTNTENVNHRPCTTQSRRDIRNSEKSSIEIPNKSDTIMFADSNNSGSILATQKNTVTKNRNRSRLRWKHNTSGFHSYINPYRMFGLRSFDSMIYTSLILSLGPLSEHIWDLWEMAITESPLLVISGNAMRSSAIILNLLQLIYPLQYAADHRPYTNTYDEDLTYYQSCLVEGENTFSASKGLMLGGTDPLLLETLSSCPNVMIVGVSKDLCSLSRSYDSSLFQKLSSGFSNFQLRKNLIATLQSHSIKNYLSTYASPNSHTHKPPRHTPFQSIGSTVENSSHVYWLKKSSCTSLKRDFVLLRKIQSLVGTLHHPKDPITAYDCGPNAQLHNYIALDQEIYGYFQALTRNFLYVFKDYIQPDVKQIMLNPIAKTPDPLPFTPTDFLKTLDQPCAALDPMFSALGGRRRVVNLYHRFVSTRTFRKWFSTELLRERHNTQLRQLKYCAAIKLVNLLPKLTVRMANHGCEIVQSLLHECRNIDSPNDVANVEKLLAALKDYVVRHFTKSLGVVRLRLPHAGCADSATSGDQKDTFTYASRKKIDVVRNPLQDMHHTLVDSSQNTSAVITDSFHSTPDVFSDQPHHTSNVVTTSLKRKSAVCISSPQYKADTSFDATLPHISPNVAVSQCNAVPSSPVYLKHEPIDMLASDISSDVYWSANEYEEESGL